MGTTLCLLLFISIHFCTALEKHHFDYYLNKSYFNESSSASPSLSTISAIPMFESTMLPDPGDSNGDANLTAVRIVVFTTIGCIIFIVLLICCILSCCRRCGRRTERRGYIVINSETNVTSQPVVIPTLQQPTVVQHIPPDYSQGLIQHFPPEYQPQPLSPTQYGYQNSPTHVQSSNSPGQPYAHYSPVLPGYNDTSAFQFFNPPEPPPPYEFRDQNKQN